MCFSRVAEDKEHDEILKNNINPLLADVDDGDIDDDEEEDNTDNTDQDDNEDVRFIETPDFTTEMLNSIKRNIVDVIRMRNQQRSITEGLERIIFQRDDWPYTSFVGHSDYCSSFLNPSCQRSTSHISFTDSMFKSGKSTKSPTSPGYYLRDIERPLCQQIGRHIIEKERKKIARDHEIASHQATRRQYTRHPSYPTKRNLIVDYKIPSGKFKFYLKHR